MYQCTYSSQPDMDPQPRQGNINYPQTEHKEQDEEKMMTPIYPPSGPHGTQYFCESPVLYGSNKMAIKHEPVEDLIETERPVDMSLAAREAKTHRHHPTLGSDNIRNEGNHFLFLHQHHHQNHHLQHQHLQGMAMANNHHEQIQNSSVETSPTSMSVESPSSDNENYHIKGNNGKLTIPAILSKNGRSPNFRPVDLSPVGTHQRAKREFVPDNKKDDSYWCKRLKNNDSARRSRVKRKALEKMMESRLMDLQKENIELKHEMAALKRRFGVDEGSSSDSSCSPLEQTSRHSPPLPEENEDKQGEDLERQSSGSDDSRSNDDARVYNMGSVTALSHALGPAGRDRADSMGSNSSSVNSSRMSISSRPNSRNSQSGSVDMALRTDVSGALDLTSDHSNRSTPGWESSSPDSFTGSSTNCNRRYSNLSTDSILEDGSGIRSLKSFPLKCRFKKEMHAAQIPVNEELQ